MKYVLRLDEITMDHLALVGGKAARLGELTRAGFPVPAGFCVTSSLRKKTRLPGSSGHGKNASLQKLS